MKIVTIVGARPQFVKAAMVSRALRRTPAVREALVHTGQHYDYGMSQIFFDELDIPAPDINFGIGGGTHGQNTGRMIEQIEKHLLTERPDGVLVYGDTDSTLAGALAAVKQHIPVAHVEAGLRSFNRNMPEEINRVLTDHISDLLFAPTQAAIVNLEREGISGRGVVRTGDVMFDAAMYYKTRARRPDIPHLPDSGFVLCTLHRAENTDDPARLDGILESLCSIARTRAVVLPVHPRTRARLQNWNGASSAPSSLHVVPPVGYLEMLYLLQRCTLVMTDSGGLQKEAAFFRRPCITLRDETEWVELTELGVNRLGGAEAGRILEAYDDMNGRNVDIGDLYGNGHSAEAIADSILDRRGFHP